MSISNRCLCRFGPMFSDSNTQYFEVFTEIPVSDLLVSFKRRIVIIACKQIFERHNSVYAPNELLAGDVPKSKHILQGGANNQMVMRECEVQFTATGLISDNSL